MRGLPDSGDAESILAMYRRGWFPMARSSRARHEWVQPEERCLIPLDSSFHVASSLRSCVRSERFEITADAAFEQVIRRCAEPAPGPRRQTWINAWIIEAFRTLHTAGHAHSIEAWRDGVLVGGLYGVALGACFGGESMFSRPQLGGRDASKVCLVHLVHHLRRRGFELLDAQIENPHLAQFGAFEIPRAEYLSRLERALRRGPSWLPFEPGLTPREL